MSMHVVGLMLAIQFNACDSSAKIRTAIAPISYSKLIWARADVFGLFSILMKPTL